MRTSHAGAARHRLVVKLGTRLLTGSGDTLDRDLMAGLVAQIAGLREAGHEVLLVSSGAVAAGRQVLRGRPEAAQLRGDDLPQRQVLAALGQGELMRTYDTLFATHGIAVAQALISRGDIANRQRYLNVRNTLEALLQIGAIPIINENDVVAVEEIAGGVFGDNDRLSASVANAVNADGLLLLGHEEGLFTADPNLHADAEPVPVVERIDARIEAMAGEARDGRGRGGMRSKVEAARMATRFGAFTVIASGRTPDVLARIVRGEPVGTRFEPTTDRVEGWKRFILTGNASSRGSVTVDEGAARALRYGGHSLLPAGVVSVTGKFDRGDNIAVLGPAGAPVAWGIANYRSDEIDRIKRRRSGEIEAILGHEYGPEIVHRNNMALADNGDPTEGSDAATEDKDRATSGSASRAAREAAGT